MGFSELSQQKPTDGGHRVGASTLAWVMGYSLAQTKSTVPEQLGRGQEAILLCKL